MKRIIIVIFVLLSLTACTKSQNKLRIGIIKPSIDHLPLSYAVSQNLINKQDNELIYFNSGWEVQEALVNKKLDVAILPFTFIWTAKAKGYPIKTISCLERETDGIITDSTIKTLFDLNNKKIGILKASTLDAFINNLAQRKKINITPVYFRTPGELVAALQSKEVNAIVTYVPIIQKLSNKYRVLYWFSQDNPEHPCCNLACTDDALQKNKLQIKRLMITLNKVVNEINNQKSNPLLLKFIEQTYKLDETKANEALKHTVFKLKIKPKDIQFEYNTMKTFLQMQYIPKLPNPEDIYDKSIINEL